MAVCSPTFNRPTSAASSPAGPARASGAAAGASTSTASSSPDTCARAVGRWLNQPGAADAVSGLPRPINLDDDSESVAEGFSHSSAVAGAATTGGPSTAPQPLEMSSPAKKMSARKAAAAASAAVAAAAEQQAAELGQQLARLPVDLVSRWD